MTISYIDKYNIVDTYKDNNFQKILIGSSKDEKQDSVIINIIKDSDIFDGLEEADLSNIFINLLHLEKSNEEVVFVGALRDAIPLGTYLDNIRPSIKERMDLLYTYLQSITRYNGLKDEIISMLVDEGQIVVDKGTILLDELIILPEESSTQEITAIGKIIRVIDKITYTETLGQMEHIYNEQLSLFKEEILNEENPLKSLNDIFKAFRKRYIYSLCIEGFEEPETDGRLKKQKVSADSKPYNEKIYIIKETIKQNNKMIIAIGMAIILTLSLFTGYRFLNLKIKAASDSFEGKLPLAYFEIQQTDKEWEFTNKSLLEGYTLEEIKISWQISKEGVLLQTFHQEDLKIIIEESGSYVVTLTLRDIDDGWYKEYSEEIIVLDQEEREAKGNGNQDENNKVGILDSAQTPKGTLEKDLEIKRNNTHTYKIVESPTIIQLGQVNLRSNTVLSMWVMMETTEKLQIKVIGYKDKIMQFQEIINHTPINLGFWEMIQLSIKESASNNIEIQVAGFSNPLWINDLQISSLK